MEEITHELSIAQVTQAGSIGRSVAKWIAASFAFALGATVVFTIGFSSNDFVHGAAHDVRHANGFPCH
jgi:cobalt transporter subunit CbtB